jgi:hypothetical protein
VQSGAQPGNHNAAKARRWQKALERALARDGGTVDGGLDPIADDVVRRAKAGDQAAQTEIGNRLDGKPAQQVTLMGDSENPLAFTEVTRKIIK